MAFKNAQQSRVLVGKTSFSGFTRNVSLDVSIDMLDVTTIADAAKVMLPGQDTSTFGLDMVLDTDTTAGGQWSNATTWKSTQPAVLTYAPGGMATGSEVWLLSGLQTSFSTKSTAAGVVEASIAAQTDGASDAGVSVEDLSSVTITGNGTARDGAAASTNGGVAHLHLTSITNTQDIVTIEHSVDGATGWATLVTFATATSATSERVVVAPGTTVRRYLRVVDTITGAGTTVRQVSFARR